MKLSEFKEAVKNVLRERSINAISKLQQKNIENIEKALEFYKKNKHTDKKEPFIKLLKKLGKEKIALAKELDLKVSGMYKNAEYKGENVVMNHDGKSAPYGSGYKKVNEIGHFPVTNYIKGIIPQGRLNTNTPELKKQSTKMVKDLRNTLNTFWKQHDIPYRIK